VATNEISLAYDAGARRAVLTFPNGRQLTVSNVSAEQAEDFRKRHGAEFQKRDCALQTVDGTFTREGDDE